MPHATVIATNGQTLTVNASVSHWTSAALAAVASGDDDVASTTTTTITSDYSLFFADTATTATITVKQLDGTTLWADTVQVGPGVGTRRIAPAPDRFQVAADSDLDAGGVLYTTGEGSYDRMLCTSTVAGVTGVMRFTFFTATRSETVTKAAAWVGGTAAAATPTLCRFGLYTVTAAGAGTLVASTTNDTGLFATINVKSEKALSASYAKVAGQRYAMGALVVSAGTCPTLLASAHETGIGAGSRPLMATAPRLAGYIGSLTDLPASFVDGDFTNTGAAPYYELT